MAFLVAVIVHDLTEIITAIIFFLRNFDNIGNTSRGLIILILHFLMSFFLFFYRLIWKVCLFYQPRTRLASLFLPWAPQSKSS